MVMDLIRGHLLLLISPAVGLAIELNVCHVCSLQVLMGAASVNSNGTVVSRCGSAAVAMMADAAGVPVIICCETYKFSSKVFADPIILCATLLPGMITVVTTLSKAEGVHSSQCAVWRGYLSWRLGPAAGPQHCRKRAYT